jgi:hypothetical protein
MAEVPVDYFGYGNPLVRWKARRSLVARQRMFAVMMRELRPTAASRVVDVGVTPDGELADSNAFERFYPWPHNVVATSFEDASVIEQRFPGVRFVRTDGDSLPFADGEFDVAVAVAVLEHVGDRDAQRRFLAELTRVAPAVFVTTPNRWFPLELHTMLPLVHWLPQRAHQWVLRRLGLRTWAETSHLNLIGRRDVARLVEPGVRATVTGHRIAGWTSNLLVVLRRDPAVVS